MQQFLHSITKRTLLFFLLYIFLVAAATFGIMPLRYQIPFLLYAIFIFAVLWDPLHRPEEIEAVADEKRYKKFFSFLLLFSFAFLLISRLLPFIRWGEAPLGYDTGFYWQYFNLITGNGTSANAVGSRIAYSFWFPYYYLGFSPLFTISALHVLHQIATAGALYFLIRSLPFQRTIKLTSSVVLFLFATSITQFMGYWWMFYKQSMAIPFLLLGIALFLRRSPLAIPVLAFGAALHAPIAVPFGLALIFFLFFRCILCIVKKEPIDRDVWILIVSIVLTLPLLFFLQIDFHALFEHFFLLSGLATNAPAWQIAPMKGLFIPFSTFRLNIIFYLPFALLGVLTLPSWLIARKNKNLALLPILGLITFVLAAFPFLYQHRFLVVLDLMLMLFASFPLALFFTRLSELRYIKIIICVFVLGLLLFSTRVIWNNPPQIYPDEIAEIRTIKDMRKPGDYAMTISAIYTPWLFAFTDFQETIVPGWLYWIKWDLAMWKQFWQSANDERRHELLRMYGDHDIYLFIGKRDNPHPNLKKFIETDPHFTKISTYLWRYSP